MAHPRSWVVGSKAGARISSRSSRFLGLGLFYHFLLATSAIRNLGQHSPTLPTCLCVGNQMWTQLDILLSAQDRYECVLATFPGETAPASVCFPVRVELCNVNDLTNPQNVTTAVSTSLLRFSMTGLFCGEVGTECRLLEPRHSSFEFSPFHGGGKQNGIQAAKPSKFASWYELLGCTKSWTKRVLVFWRPKQPVIRVWCE